MAGKLNIRSIRFSDELAELIGRQAGSSFTEKFENLVTRCVWELPQKEEELERLEKDIQKERKRFTELQKKREQLEGSFRILQQTLDSQLKELEKL